MQGYNFTLSAFVVPLTIDMALLLSQTVIHPAGTILEESAEVPGGTLYTKLAEKEDYFSQVKQ